MRKKNFTTIARAKQLPAATAQALGITQLEGENRLEVRNEGDETHIYLSGSVGKSWWDDGGITEKEVRDAIKAVKKGKPLHVHINSEGGSVQEGLGIYNAIKERSADITCYVDGYALSIASVFPLAASKVVSPKSAIWMIHNAWSWASGNAADMEAQAKMLREHDQMLNEIYQEHTGKSADEIKAAMDAETWIRGSAAVEWGLADETDTEPDADDANAAYAPLPQAWLDRCANIPANILNALRRIPSPATNGDSQTLTPASGGGESTNQPITVAGETLSASPSAGANTQPLPSATSAAQTTTTPMPDNNTPAAANPTATDVENLRKQVEALHKTNLTNRVESYVTAQKITKAEVPIYVEAALRDSDGTFKILDAKTATTAGAEPIGAASEITVTEWKPAAAGMTSKAMNRYAALRDPKAKNRYNALKRDWDSMIQDAFAQDAAANAELTRRNIQPLNSNTYSSTLVTAFLTDGAHTVLQHRLAALRCFSRDFSTDPYKPLAVAQHKFVSAGPTVQTDATNFESGNSTVDPITITPHQYSSSINVSNSDLNSGLRMENLTTIAAAKLGNKIIEAATAPITLTNFTLKSDSAGTGNVITAANFTFTDLARIWGVLQKAPMKYAILDGAYLAKLLLQPTYFQDLELGEGMLKAFGWDGVALNSDWTGASDNIAAFFCDPQAIAVLAGLPLTPPSGIPGNTLQQGVFTLDGVELSVQTNSWFALSSRTAWMSYDVVFGAAKMDATAGVAVATA